MGKGAKDAAAKKCNGDTKQQLRMIHMLCGKAPHESCGLKGRGLSVQIDGNRLNAYTECLNAQAPKLTDYRFTAKPYTVCANMERTINKELVAYDKEQNRLEEEYFANQRRYNLCSNANNIVEDEIWVDNQFNAIEEAIVEEEAIDSIDSGRSPGTGQNRLNRLNRSLGLSWGWNSTPSRPSDRFNRFNPGARIE